MEPKKVLKIHSFLYGISEILGYKGNTIIETDYIYAPYLNMFIEEDFRPRQGIASRYARKIVNNSHYGIVTVGTDTQNT
jgi:hypothetical protein